MDKSLLIKGTKKLVRVKESRVIEIRVAQTPLSVF